MNDSAGHISFINECLSNRFHFSESNSVNLRSKSFLFHILKCIPRIFKITTNNGYYNFNIEILKDTSSTVAQYIKDYPNQQQYHLNINDERIILRKIELMYQGESILFEKDDYPTLKTILDQLQILRFPRNQLENIDEVSLIDFDNQTSDLFSSRIIISIQDFNHYLKETAPKNFIITTNKSSYQCNIFGVFASKKIGDFISKNPTSLHYFFDFSDESNEFQLICDIFNFKSIKITPKNVYILNELAEELQIDEILNDVRKYIEDGEIVFKTIDEQQEISDSIEEIFDWLYNIKTLTVEKVKYFIVNSIWIKNEDNIKEMAAFFIHLIDTEFQLQKYLADLIIELNEEKDKLNILLPFIVDKLLASFALNSCNCSFIYILFSRGIIQKEILIRKILAILDQFDISCSYGPNILMENIFLWFLPEIIELKPDIKKYSSFFSTKKDNVMIFYYDKIDLYKKMRENGEPNDEITKSMRYDDIDSFKDLVSYHLDHLSKYFVPFNIYENYVPNGSTSYINYAAAYGSIKCFKYMLLNHVDVDESTFSFAVYGGNIEIIKIVEQHLNNTELENKNDNLILTIIKHQNNLFDWIYEQKYLENDQNSDLLNLFVSLSVVNGNAHSLIKLINNGYDFSNHPNFCYHLLQTASRKGFYKMTKLLFLLMQVKLNFEKIQCSTNLSLLDQGYLYTNLPFNINAKSKDKNENMNNLFEGLNNFDSFPIYQYENNRIPSVSFDTFNFESSVYFGIFSIFKLYEKFMSQFDIENVINFAVINNFNQFIDYFFSTIIKNDFKIRQTFVSKILTNSAKKENSCLFNFILDQLMKAIPDFLKSFDLSIDILETACKYKNFDAAKTVIDFIIKNKDKNKTHNTEQDQNQASTSFSNKSTYSTVNAYPPPIYSTINTYSTVNKYPPPIYSTMNTYSTVNKYPQPVYTHMPALTNVFVNKCPNTGNDNNKNDFTRSFIEAFGSESFDICKYFIDNKICINYSELILHAYKFKLINCKILSLLIDNSSYFHKKQLIGNFIIPSIQKKNKDTIEYLLSNDAPMDDTLFEAVNTHNIEIVNIILKFNSKPFFINKISIHGTALHLAVMNKDIDIIKLLISLPGIDVNKIDSSNRTPLQIAFDNYSYDIVRILLSNEKVETNILSNDYNYILISVIKQRNIEIATLLIKHPKTNINIQNNQNPYQTALIEAVILNLDDIIDLLINDQKFDPEESRLNYAFFISSNETSKHLINAKSLDVNYIHYEKIPKQIENQSLNPNYLSSNQNIIQKNEDFIVEFQTTLSRAVKLKYNEKVNLIISHHSFDKNISYLSTGFDCSIKEENS